MSHPLTRYVPQEVVHQDWLGISYKAYDTEGSRPVTLRLIDRRVDGLAATGQALRASMHCSEAPLQENIPAVYEVGDAMLAGETPRAVCFVVSEWTHGERLSNVLGGHPIDPRRAHNWMVQVLLGLSAANRRGLLHADINPSNILVCADDAVRLLDLGLYSKLAFPELEEEASAGWPLFMAPEQLLGEDASVRTGIRAAGILLYLLLVGQPPFVGSKASVMQQVLSEEVPVASRRMPSLLGLHFDPVIARATARHVEMRYRSAEEFLHALNRAAFESFGAAQESDAVDAHWAGDERWVGSQQSW